MPIYTETQRLPYAQEQIFDLVADVERYPEFLPGLISVRVHGRRQDKVCVDMTVAIGPLKRRVSTIGLLRRPTRIDISSADPLFEHFQQSWIFEALPGATKVTYQVDFEIASALLDKLAATVFINRAMMAISAFRRRADALFGTASGKGRHMA